MHGTQEHSSSPGFWGQRTGWTVLKQVLFLEPLPGGSRWAAAFGSLLLFAFLLQVVTGVLLAMNYAPSVDSAWSSVQFIQEEVPLGAFIRALHHWGSSAMVILLLLHLLQVFIWGAYKKPRELTWMAGVLLLVCTLGLAFTGYLLPWDQKAYWATRVGLGIASTTPVIGDGLRTLLQGGPEMGNLTLTRFFSMHAFVLPGLLIFLVVVHLYLFRFHGVTPPWWASSEQLKAQEEPFWPKQLLKDGIVCLVYLVGLGIWCYHQAAPLEAQADPSQPYEARPEWYFMFLFQLLRYFEGPYEIVGTFVLPTLFFLVLFFWPFLDRLFFWELPHRNPVLRPAAIGLLTLGTAGLISLTIYAIATDVRMTEPAQAAATKAVPAAEPAGPIQRADVARIYNDNCAACHSVDGSGKQIRAAGMPTIPDLTSLAWQMSQTDLEIAQRIQDGNEPLMPAYRDKLSQQQILALTVYVRAFAVVPEAVGLKPAPLPVKLPSEPDAQMHAEQVYRAYCLGCHDSNGKGTIGKKAMPTIPDFTQPNWKRTDKEIAQAIQEGQVADRKLKFMTPMKDKLGQTDVRDLIKLVRAFGEGKVVEPESEGLPEGPPSEPKIVKEDKKPLPKKRPPPSAEETARRRVATRQYRQYCLSCHGADGKGLAMKADMSTIPDFSDRPWQASVSNEQLAASILDSKGLMPGFRAYVSEEQAQNLTAYVRQFGPEIPPPPEGESDFEKRFREVQAHWYEMQRQLRELSKPPRSP
jgi:quinol-cytochrome oxidoreductase complex cytochrome b subunit/mono/diheme cytochrome c family protein